MHLIGSFAIVALFTLNPLAAQVPIPQSASQPSGLQIQPFKLAAADFKAMLYGCQPTTLAGATYCDPPVAGVRPPGQFA